MAGNLHASARRGDLEAVREFGEDKVEVNTALKTWRSRKLVVDFHEDVNSVDMHGMTALHYSSKRGHTDIVEYLLQTKASVEVRNAIGQTPLFTAAQAGKLEPAEILIAYKSNPNATGDHGIRPIHRAAMAGHDEVVRLLLRVGADALAVDEFVNEGAIHLAAREGHAEVIRSIMGAVPRQTEEGIDEEEKSKEKGRWGMMEDEVQRRNRRRRLDDGNTRGETALHLAAANGRADCVKLLLRMGSTDRWRSWFMGKQEGASQNTALHIACHAGHSEVVRLLLDSLANPTMANVIGRTPLHLAIASSTAQAVTYLLRAGADLVAVDHDGRRPIATDAGPWLNTRTVPPKIQAQLQELQQPPSRGASRGLLPRSAGDQHRGAGLGLGVGPDVASEVVKMQLIDVGSGIEAQRQMFTTRRRMQLALGRRKEAARVQKVMLEDEVGVKKIQQEALARAKRILNHRLDAERAEIEHKMRQEWAQKKVARWWRRHKERMMEERRAREKSRRKAAADRLRKAQEEGLLSKASSRALLQQQ